MQERPDRWRNPMRSRQAVRLLVGALIVGLLLCSCAALALIPLFAARAPQESQTDHAFQALFAALFALLGVLLMLTERQLRQQGWSRSPVSFGALLFTTPAGLTFWTGLALFGIALARLEAPAAADPLNMLFWALAALWLLAEVILSLRRPGRARAPGREPGE